MRRRVPVLLQAFALVAVLLSTAGAATTPSRDLSDRAVDASFPRLASGAGGTVALWREQHGDDWLVYAASSDANSAAWSTPSRLSSPGADALDAQVALASNGDALAIWDGSDGAHQIVQSASRPAGKDWTAAQNVSAPGADAYHSQVALGPGGSAVAVWSRSDGNRNVIQAAVLPAGGPWGAAVDLSDPDNVTRSPQVAVGGDGTAVAVWQRSDGDYSTIHSSVLAPGGAWSAPLRLSVPGGEASSPRVAMDDAGDALAIWRWYDGLNWIIASSFRPAGHDWQRVRQVSVAGISARPAGLAMNGSGRAVAIWAESTGLWSSRFGANGRWGGERQVEDDSGGPIGGAPSVAINASGDETALWSEGGSLFGSFRAHDADDWDESREVDCQDENADTCFFTSQSRTVITAPGKALAVWLEFRDRHEVLTSAAYDNIEPADTADEDTGGEPSADSSADDSDAGTGLVLDSTAALLTRKRIRLTVSCRTSHECRGHLVLRRAFGHVALAGRSVRVPPGRSAALVLRLTGLPRSVLLRGARMRTRVIVERTRDGRQLGLTSHSLVIVGRLETRARSLSSRSPTVSAASSQTRSVPDQSGGTARP
jgi:hypothetical protein